jgi:hypothetical protein
VSFESQVDFSGREVALHCDEDAPDGARVSIKIDGARRRLDLHDWELRPIVDFADTDYTAVVTLFGEGPEPERYFHNDYHRAFEETHLGARLLQSDILLMDPIVFSEALSEELAAEPYSAWVLTGADARPVVEIRGGEAHLALEPHYYFWRYADDPERKRLIALAFEGEALRAELLPQVEA